MPEISPDLRVYAQQVFAGQAGDQKPCDHCGGVHSRQCPRLRSLKQTYTDAGKLASYDVEFWAPGTWEDTVIFPEDVFEPDDAREGD